MGLYLPSAVLMAGSRAAEAWELRQSRKEATVTGTLRVPRECLARVVLEDMLRGRGQREVHGLNLRLLYSMKQGFHATTDHPQARGP